MLLRGRVGTYPLANQTNAVDHTGVGRLKVWVVGVGGVCEWLCWWGGGCWVSVGEEGVCVGVCGFVGNEGRVAVVKSGREAMRLFCLDWYKR